MAKGSGFRPAIARGAVWAQWGPAIRAAIAVVLAGILQVTPWGPGGGEARAEDRPAPPPLSVYPNQVFRTAKPGQVGLYIDGENWHLLIDLPGYADEGSLFSAASQFCRLQGASTGTLLSIFADQYPGVEDEQSCRLRAVPETRGGREQAAKWVGDKGTVSEVADTEVRGKWLTSYEIVVPEFGPQKIRYSSKAIHATAYYRKFCFDFHFTVTNDADPAEVLANALESVTYVPARPAQAIERLFYLHDRFRIRLDVPLDWQFAYRPGRSGPEGGGIELQPQQGPMFSFLVVPLGRIRSMAASDQPEAVAEARRRSFEGRGGGVSPLRKLCSGDTCIHYFDLTAPGESRGDQPLYQRQGWIRTGVLVMGTSMLFDESSKDAAERFTATLTRAGILDIAEARRSAASR